MNVSAVLIKLGLPRITISRETTTRNLGGLGREGDIPVINH